MVSEKVRFDELEAKRQHDKKEKQAGKKTLKRMLSCGDKPGALNFVGRTTHCIVAAIGNTFRIARMLLEARNVGNFESRMKPIKIERYTNHS